MVTCFQSTQHKTNQHQPKNSCKPADGKRFYWWSLVCKNYPGEIQDNLDKIFWGKRTNYIHWQLLFIWFNEIYIHLFIGSFRQSTWSCPLSSSEWTLVWLPNTHNSMLTLLSLVLALSAAPLFSFSFSINENNGAADKANWSGTSDD